MNEFQYCSWCHKKTKHALTKKLYATRNEYICTNCKQNTVMCRIPSCTHMAKHNKNWADELCSEDNGSLYNSFQYLDNIRNSSNIRISSLDEYKTILNGSYKVECPEWLKMTSAIIGTFVIPHQYRKTVNFEIKKLESGNSQSNIINLFINGFLTENDDDHNWKNSSFDNDENYILMWESGNLVKLLKSIANLEITTDNIWYKTASKTGPLATILSTIISKLDTVKKINIYGHSLGALIISKLLNIMATNNNNKINNVILLGGATSSSKEEWNKVTKAISGKIFNFYSENDFDLTYLYQIAEWKSPIGLGEIEHISNKIVNKDVSNLVDGHTDYARNLSAILKYVK